MNVRFNLKDRKTKRTSIILIVRHFQKSLKWATGLHISPTLFDSKTNRPKKGQLAQIRSRLDQLQVIAENVLSTSGYLEQADFKKLMDCATGKIELSEKTPYLLEFVSMYCLENKRKALRTTARVLFNYLTESTLERWEQVDFTKARRKDIRFDSIDWNLRQGFYSYCLKCGFSLSYTQATLKRFAQFINEARKRGHHNNSISVESGFQLVKQSVKQLPISLGLDEILKLANLSLTGQEEKVRDLFLIGIFTGQRFSDYSSIKPNQVRNGAVFFRQKKTGAIVEIDLDMFAGLVPQSLGDLLAKYSNSSPSLSNGANGSVIFNRLIKFICRRAGIHSKVEWLTTNGGLINVEQFEKWRVVSSHTARRSFATIWAKMGLPLADIASATGHTTEKQLIEYIGLSHEEKRDKRRVAVDIAKANLKAI